MYMATNENWVVKMSAHHQCYIYHLRVTNSSTPPTCTCTLDVQHMYICTHYFINRNKKPVVKKLLNFLTIGTLPCTYFTVDFVSIVVRQD